MAASEQPAVVPDNTSQKSQAKSQAQSQNNSQIVAAADATSQKSQKEATAPPAFTDETSVREFMALVAT